MRALSPIYRNIEQHNCIHSLWMISLSSHEYTGDQLKATISTDKIFQSHTHWFSLFHLRRIPPNYLHTTQSFQPNFLNIIQSKSFQQQKKPKPTHFVKLLGLMFPKLYSTKNLKWYIMGIMDLSMLWLSSIPLRNLQKDNAVS